MKTTKIIGANSLNPDKPIATAIDAIDQQLHALMDEVQQARPDKEGLAARRIAWKRFTDLNAELRAALFDECYFLELSGAEAGPKVREKR